MQADAGMNVGAVPEFCFTALTCAICKENFQRTLLIQAWLKAGAGEMSKTEFPASSSCQWTDRSNPNI